MRDKWEKAYQAGVISATKLQAAYASVYAITSHTDSKEWRQEQLRRYPAPEF